MLSPLSMSHLAPNPPIPIYYPKLLRRFPPSLFSFYSQAFPLPEEIACFSLFIAADLELLSLPFLDILDVLTTAVMLLYSLPHCNLSQLLISHGC